MTENPIRLSPQELILNYYKFKNSKCLSLDELVGISIALGCPNTDIAQKVLANMVDHGSLEWFKDEQDRVNLCLASEDDQIQ